MSQFVDSVAQPVEQPPFKRCVVGSNPSGIVLGHSRLIQKIVDHVSKKNLKKTSVNGQEIILLRLRDIEEIQGLGESLKLLPKISSSDPLVKNYLKNSGLNEELAIYQNIFITYRDYQGSDVYPYPRVLVN